MKEKDFQGWVIDVFKRYGWDVKHAPTPMRPVAGGKFVPDRRGRGLLDLLMTHDDPPRLLFAEIKTHGGRLSPAQTDMLKRLRLVADECRRAVDTAQEWSAFEGVYPLGVYVFQPGNEAMIEAVARGADGG